MDRKKAYDGVSVLHTQVGTKVRTIGGLGSLLTSGLLILNLGLLATPDACSSKVIMHHLRVHSHPSVTHACINLEIMHYYTRKNL